MVNSHIRFVLVLAVAGCGNVSGSLPDAPPPTPVALQLTITQPTDHVTLHGSRALNVTGSIATTHRVQSVTATSNGTAAGTATFTDTAFSIALTVGDNAQTIVVTATDDAGETAMATVHVTYPFVALPTFASATLVLGQPDFGTTTSALSPTKVATPYGRPWWDGTHLWLGDFGHSRVIAYTGFPSRNGEPADFVLGAPNLTTAATVGITAVAVNGAQSVQVVEGKLYVGDYLRRRIMSWNTVPTMSDVAADHVAGQPDLMTNNTTVDQSTLNNTEDFFITGNKLIVADSNNNRVLIWNMLPADGAPADVVLGQADFTHKAANDDNGDGVSDGPPTARTFNYPSSIWSDGTNLVIADAANNRVLIWNQIPTVSFTPADHVLGQPGFITNSAGAGAGGLNYPYFLDSNGTQLAVADSSNHRVVIWNTMPTIDQAQADAVLGQGDFAHITPNDDNQDLTIDATPSNRTFRSPAGIRFVRDTLIVADEQNSRYLVFGKLPCGDGEFENPPGSGTCVADPCVGQCAGMLCDNSTGAAVCY
jgi:hypothetical protein